MAIIAAMAPNPASAGVGDGAYRRQMEFRDVLAIGAGVIDFRGGTGLPERNSYELLLGTPRDERPEGRRSGLSCIPPAGALPLVGARWRPRCSCSHPSR